MRFNIKCSECGTILFVVEDAEIISEQVCPCGIEKQREVYFKEFTP